VLILMWAGSATAGMGEVPLVEANSSLVAHPQDEATAVVVGTVVLRGFSAAELPVEKQSPMVRHLVAQGRLPPTHLVYTVTIDEVIADSQHELEVGQVVRISAGNAGVPSVWNQVGVRSATAQTQLLRQHFFWQMSFGGTASGVNSSQREYSQLPVPRTLSSLKKRRRPAALEPGRGMAHRWWIGTRAMV